jgi:beta-1,4-mannosyltransferase
MSSRRRFIDTEGPGVPKPFVVQLAFRTPRATTNPYIVMLFDSLRTMPDAEARTFSWPRALLGRYDVFHVHWPEILVSGRRPAAVAARVTLFLLLLARLRVTSTPYVRTVHNIGMPGGLNRWQLLALRLAERQTAVRIVLTPHTPVPPGAATALIPHGDYRDWFKGYPRRPSEPGRVLFFGQVRNYKGLPALVAAYRGVSPGMSSTLVIAGQPTSAELADELRNAACDDQRIELRFEHLPDRDLVDEISRSQLVVLPHPQMHNSGSVLAALSLDRPVLVPDNAVNNDLAAEVGPQWVRRFTAPLAPDDLSAALTAPLGDDAGTPDLSARDWSQTGAAHLEAFRRARGGRRR